MRDTKSALAVADIDWTAWYLTEEEDMGESWQQARISRVFEEILQRWVAERGDKRSRVSFPCGVCATARSYPAQPDLGQAANVTPTPLSD